MAEIYGHRWTSAYGDNPNEGAALTWAKGLAGITPQQVGDGLRACVSSSDPWPPTLPEFRGMCLSIPTLAQVKLDQNKASPFVRLVWAFVDSHRVRSASADLADKLMREAYGLAREHVMRGGDLPPEPAGELAHEARPIVVAPPEVAEARIAEGRELLGRVAATAPKKPTVAEFDKAAIEADLQAHYGKGKKA